MTRRSAPAARVIVVGSINVDRLIRCGSRPRAGETVLARTLTLAFGGKGGNQAVAAARLGLSTWLIGAIGDDVHGGHALDDLHRAGVDVRHVVRKAGVLTGEATIIVDDNGTNSIIVLVGANAELAPDDVAQALHALRLTSSDIVLASAEIPERCVARAAELAASAGSRVLYNLAPARPLPSWTTTSLSVLIVNEVEAKQLTDADTLEAALAALQQAVPTAVVTRGSEGATVVDRGSRYDVAAEEVTVVDSTGAGDAFCGALAAELARGTALAVAAKAAALAGSMAVTTVGARGSRHSAPLGQTMVQLAEPPADGS